MGMFDTLRFEILCPYCRPQKPGFVESQVKYLGRHLSTYGPGDLLPEMTAAAIDEFRHEPAVKVDLADIYDIVSCPHDRHHLAVCIEIRNRAISRVYLLEDQTEARRLHRRVRAADRRTTKLFGELLKADVDEN